MIINMCRSKWFEVRKGSLDKNPSSYLVFLHICVDLGISPIVDGFLVPLEDSQYSKNAEKGASSRYDWGSRSQDLKSALEIGMKDEMRRLDARLSMWSREKLEKTGLAIFDLQVYNYMFRNLHSHEYHIRFSKSHVLKLFLSTVVGSPLRCWTFNTCSLRSYFKSLISNTSSMERRTLWIQAEKSHLIICIPVLLFEFVDNAIV